MAKIPIVYDEFCPFFSFFSLQLIFYYQSQIPLCYQHFSLNKYSGVEAQKYFIQLSKCIETEKIYNDYGQIIVRE